MTLAFPARATLELSRSLNRQCEHIIGDMKTVRLGRVFEHARGHKDRRDATRFEIGDVVHTARRTRPSVG